MTQLSAPWLDDAPSREVTGMLADAGHKAWFVGGCVRNALLGAPVADLDISTDAWPERVMELARGAGLKAVPTGIDHGTVTVIAQDRPYEITTFRRDVETDGRRAVVAFANTLEEDAHRRDFTMNALYAAPDGTLADPLGGLADLAARRVRFIDDAEARIREDYLRILRFFRFHAWYGDPEIGLDLDGLAACAENATGIDTLSKERIGHEMRRLLAAPDPAPAVASMAAAGILWRILPGADSAPLPVLVHVESQEALPPASLRRLAVLGGEDVEARLRLSKAEVRELETLRRGLATEVWPGALGYREGEETALDILALRAALTASEIDPNQAELARIGAAATLPIGANDLTDRYEGKALGDALRAAEDRWIASGFTLTREDLLG